MISNAPERQRRILEMLRERETVSHKELRKRLGVTAMTIWRDLVSLEEKGLLRRSRGRSTGTEAALSEPDFHSKTDQYRSAKDHIARYAVEHFMRAGDTLAMDGGTTVAAIANQEIPPNLTILTNSLYTAERFLRHPSRPAIHVCGGLLREQSGTFIGREALSFFRRRRTKFYFLSATGVDCEKGITDLTLEDNEVKRAMASISGEVILLADQSKLGVIAPMQVFPLRRIRHLITDADPEMAAGLKRAHAGLTVHLIRGRT